MAVVPVCLLARFFINSPTGAMHSSTLYFQPDAPPSAFGDVVNAAIQLFDGLAIRILPLLHGDTKFHSVYCKYTNPVNEMEGWSTQVPQTGTGALQTGIGALPDEVCIGIQRRTGKAGRENRGRIFISPFSEASQDKGTLTSSAQTGAKSIASYIGADITLTTNPMGVLHARHWDRKNNQLDVVTQCRALNVVVSRRDRRSPLKPMPIQ